MITHSLPVYILVLLYHIYLTNGKVHLKIDSVQDYCRIVQDKDKIERRTGIDSSEPFSYSVRSSLRNSSEVSVQLIGGNLKRVFIQVRSNSSLTSSLLGRWINSDLSDGHRIISCEGVNHSLIFNLYEISEERLTFTWNGRCFSETTFFIYMMHDEKKKWQHIRIPCEDSSSTGFTFWTEFDSCSVTCGEGVQTRNRACLIENCIGNTEEKQTCLKENCSSYIGACMDKFFNCKKWREFCTGNFRQWMNAYCPQTCDFCQRQTGAVHEIGHCLGLTHSQNVDSVMYPCYNGKWSKLSQNVLPKEDIERIQNAYVISNCIDDSKYKRSCIRWASQQLCTKGFWQKVIYDRCRMSCRRC